MKINHIALYVNNLDTIKEFYQKYFRATANQKYHNPKTGLETYFLTFRDSHGESLGDEPIIGPSDSLGASPSDARLEIMTRPGLQDASQSAMHLGYTHLAFSVGSKQQVDAITRQLREDGFTVVSGPRTTGDGYYESCVLDPENNQIEIVE